MAAGSLFFAPPCIYEYASSQRNSAFQRGAGATNNLRNEMPLPLFHSTPISHGPLQHSWNHRLPVSGRPVLVRTAKNIAAVEELARSR